MNVRAQLLEKMIQWRRLHLTVRMRSVIVEYDNFQCEFYT